MFKTYIETLRPRQWTKNVVIFAGLIFDGQFLQPYPFLRVLAATLLFCLVSGITYTINDLLDVEADRLHPIKKNRPVASGRLGKKQAIIYVIILSIFSLLASYLLSPRLSLILIAYTLLFLAYSLWLKNFDCGRFGHRSWLCFTCFSRLSVISQIISPLASRSHLAFGGLSRIWQTFGELKLLENNAGNTRKTLEGYTIPLLNQYIQIIITLFSSPTRSTPFLPIFPSQLCNDADNSLCRLWHIRYLYLLQNETITATPEEVLLKDRPSNLPFCFGIDGHHRYLFVF